MKLSRNIILSCEILAAHKLRTLLSTIGIVIGVAAVILIVSLGRGAEEEIITRIKNMGTNLIVVNAGQTRIIAGRRRQMEQVTTLKAKNAEAIRRRCPAVANTAAAANKNMKVRWGGEERKTEVVGMEQQGLYIRNYSVARGRPFDESEDRARRRVAVIGPTVVEDVFGDGDPLGARLRIDRVPFEVIGVTAPKGMDADGQDQDDIVIVPLQTAMRRLFNVSHLDSIYVQAMSEDKLEEAENQIRPVLREQHRLKEGQPDDFTVQNQSELLETQQETSRAMTRLVGSVAGISLLVGGIGILAVMLVSVRERTREIGLRRAVGAMRRDIRNQFLFESGLLAGTGGLAGVLIGVGGAWAASAFGQWNAVISWPAIVVAFSFSAALGIIFGLYPALRAAGLEPTEALRAE
ncbi:MAG: ABC transporter permease [Candidatus Brocadiia bacterium]